MAAGKDLSRGSLTEQFDRLVRHRGVLGRHAGLRNLLRKPYHRLINWHGQGIKINIGGCVPVRVPPEFSGRNVEGYESSSFRVLRDWCEANPDGVFVDVGCAIGYYSCAALFTSPTVRVVAIDSDLNSLKATERYCEYADGPRLTLIHGMISNAKTDGGDLAAAAKATRAAISAPTVTGDPGAVGYRVLDPNAATSDVPFFRLDDLLAGENLSRKPLLVKVDVEGAEWHVLNGATQTLRAVGITLLLSVHPPLLPKYDRTPADVERLLSDAEYGIDVIDKDHEEHWVCTKKQKVES